MQSDLESLELQKKKADAAVERGETALLSKSEGTSVSAPQQPWSPALIQTMGFGFLGFALVVLFLMTWLMRHTRSHVAVLRAFGLLLIISAAVFLVVVGYGEEQLAPVLGLLGTIAGYLLGKETSGTERKRTPPEPEKATAGEIDA